MKFISVFIFLSFLSLVARAGNFMPENDLWKQDCLNCLSSNSMTQELFNKIVDAGRKAYAENAAKNGERLVINALWTDSTVNANCCRGCTPRQVEVNMYGGLARRDEINPEGFALVLGHELSHAYGGEPFYPQSDRMSGEGQADYEGAKTAYKKIADLVPELKQNINVSDFISKTCATLGEDCKHSLYGGDSLGALLATLKGESKPDYETPDQTVVNETLTSYPDTVQCRLDTYLAGTLSKPRPACWFYDPAANPQPNDPWGWPQWPTWPWPQWPW